MRSNVQKVTIAGTDFVAVRINKPGSCDGCAFHEDNGGCDWFDVSCHNDKVWIKKEFAIKLPIGVDEYAKVDL